MKAITLLTPFHFGSLGTALHQLFTPRCRAAAPSAQRCAELIALLETQPALRIWVMALDGRSPRTQRALLTRAQQIFRGEFGDHVAGDILDELYDPALLRAVLAELTALAAA